MLGQGDKGSPKATVTTVPAQLEHGIAELSSNGCRACWLRMPEPPGCTVLVADGRTSNLHQIPHEATSAMPYR